MDNFKSILPNDNLINFSKNTQYNVPTPTWVGDSKRQIERVSSDIQEEKKKKEALEQQRHQEVIHEQRCTNVALEKINAELVQTNETLKLQLNSANSNLEFILNSIGANSQKLQVEAMETNIELAKLKTILKYEDEKGINDFISEHGIESIGLILQIIGMFMGK